MKKITYFGSSWLGIYLKGNNNHTLLPLDAMDKVVDTIRASLKTEPHKIIIGSSNLIGPYVAINSNGIIVPNVCGDEEMLKLKGIGLNVYKSHERNNAHGNNICVNDKGGVINPHVHAEEKRKIADTLGVELVDGSVANYTTVGSCVSANNKGFLAHFAVSENDMRFLEDALKVKGMKGTINTGAGFVSVGMVANDHGYIVGEHTTAYEMGRIEEALGFL
jgi:translation initiation factor 6